MSLILDALSRAERERRRDLGPAPDLLAEHGPAAPPSSQFLPRLAVVVVLVLVLAGATLWLVMRGESQRRDEAGATAPTQRRDFSPPKAQPLARAEGESPANRRALAGDGQRPQPDQARAAPAAADPARSPVPAAGGGSISQAEIAKLYEQRSKGDGDSNAGASGASRDSDPAAAPVPSARPADTREPPVLAERAATVEERPAARDEAPVDLERILRRARAEEAAAKLSEHPAPLLQTLSKQYRDRVPTLMYLRHDYNPAGNSTVLINSATLGVGDRSRGVEVREILADSVILGFEDREFRLRALNSWVNL